MTNDEIREVFAELHRIGFDRGRPPGLAIGTGFREGELIGWLRSRPDNMGHDAFVAQLRAHVSAATPNADEPRLANADRRPRRNWPTEEQLHAAADILVREWDPLGARLGELTRDDVSEHAYQALLILSMRQPPGLLERQIAKFLGYVELEEFGVRPSPSDQRRYLARRLMQVVVDLPGPAHETSLSDDAEAEAAAVRQRQMGARSVSFATAMPRRKTVGLGPRSDDPSPLDTTASCSECGTIGTVAVVVRDLEPRMSRFCPACWAKVRERYWRIPRPRTTPFPDSNSPEGQIAALEWLQERVTAGLHDDSRYVATALWEDQLPFLEAALVAPENKQPANRDRHLRMLAGHLVNLSPHMHGLMPTAIEDFVRKYGGPAEPPASPSQH